MRLTDRQAMETADTQRAFNRAISSGRMSERTAADYMFMGEGPNGRDTFKHRVTRQYLPY